MITGATNREEMLHTAWKGDHTATADRGGKLKTRVARKDARVVTALNLRGTRKIVAQASASIERVAFKKNEVEQVKAWKMHVTAASLAIHRLRYRGVTHKVLLLTRTIERQHDFEQAKSYSIKPGLTIWTSCPSEVRAAFYFSTVDLMLADTLSEDSRDAS